MDCGELCEGPLGRKRLCVDCRDGKYRKRQRENKRKARNRDRQRMIDALLSGEVYVKAAPAEEDVEPIGFGEPVACPPGTNERIAVYQSRVSRRLEVFHPLDRTM